MQWFCLDVHKPLRQQLAGKAIVEFPEVVVLLPEEVQQYSITPAVA